MGYIINFEEKAIQDLVRLKKTGDKSLLKKLERLLLEIKEHPRTGTGQVEQLKHFKIETWSRRINHEHRIVYHIYEEDIEIVVISIYGHY